MSWFRKKPVDVEAMRWDKGNGWALEAWCAPHPNWPDGSCFNFVTGNVYDHLHEQWIPLDEGDWIVKGVAGEFYPVKAEIFAETYEAAPNQGDK